MRGEGFIKAIARISAAFFALSLSLAAHAQDHQAAEPVVGDEYRIILNHTNESTRGTGSSSSRGGHEYVERILAVRAEGVEREFDLPLAPDDEARLIGWRFPVRVFDPTQGDLQLLNREEMEARRDLWLEAGEIPIEACGSWIFTWNAFQIDCDAESVLPTIDGLNLQPEELSDGAIFRHAAALEAGVLSLEKSGSNGRTFHVQLSLDPEVLQHEKARSDVVVGELMQTPVSFEDAFAKRTQEQVSGTIELTFEVNSNGQVWRRTTIVTSKTTAVGGGVENAISTEIVERKLVVRGP